MSAASAVQRIASRSNPLLQQLRRLAREPGAYRAAGQVWIEGEHLCRAALACGLPVQHAVLDEAAWSDPALAPLAALAHAAPRVALLAGDLFASLSALPSAGRIGFVITPPAPAALDPQAASLVLDRIQDAGNVGSVLRSAAAFGVRQVLALEGTATLWSPKVLRAGMGAHFSLALHEGLTLADLERLRVPLVATSSHATQSLAQARLPQPCAWVLGHEGQGITPALLARCSLVLRIPQPGGEESLNVAAAAAVCLYEAARQRAAAAGPEPQ